MDRRTGDGSRKVDAFDGVQTVLVDGLAGLIEEGHADVPLAEHRGGVALVSQHPRQGEAFRFDHARAAYAGEDAAKPRAKCHPPGHYAVASRRANRRWAMCIGEPHAPCREFVDVRRRNPRRRVVATDVAVPEIVGENEQDVRSRLRGECHVSEHQGQRGNHCNPPGAQHHVDHVANLSREILSVNFVT